MKKMLLIASTLMITITSWAQEYQPVSTENLLKYKEAVVYAIAQQKGNWNCSSTWPGFADLNEAALLQGIMESTSAEVNSVDSQPILILHGPVLDGGFFHKLTFTSASDQRTLIEFTSESYKSIRQNIGSLKNPEIIDGSILLHSLACNPKL